MKGEDREQFWLATYLKPDATPVSGLTNTLNDSALLVNFYRIGKDVVSLVVKLRHRFVERVVDDAGALTDDAVEPDQVGRFDSAAYKVFDNVAEIDGLAVSIRKH